MFNKKKSASQQYNKSNGKDIEIAVNKLFYPGAKLPDERRYQKKNLADLANNDTSIKVIKFDCTKPAVMVKSL